MDGIKKVTPCMMVGHCRIYSDPEAKIIVAVSRYAGKTVRGIAKCHPNDEFNEKFGIDLAVARCNLKVAEKRMARANKRVMEALVAQYNALSFVADMKDYRRRAENDLKKSIQDLEELENSNV